MTLKIYIPIDSTALSLGAEEVYRAILLESKNRKLEIEIVRNGSRGLFFLEPLVEVETNKGRMAYGPVDISDVPSLFDSEFFLGRPHKLCLGLTDEIEWLKKQERLTYARVGITDPLNIEDYEKYDGFKGLKKSGDISSSYPFSPLP